MTTIVAGVLVANATCDAQSRLAPTPPMGWNSWNIFYGNIDETKIKQIIDAMVSTGMRDAGYKYVNLDDNWMANPARNAAGDLIADPVRFKSGIKSLSDYAHSKGMKLGIYGDRGSMTCMNIPKSGSYGNEERDAKTFASWGVDYLKSAATADMTVRWSELGLGSSVFVRDVWERKDLGVFPDVYTVSVPSHGLALVKVRGWRDPKATIWLSDLHIHSTTNAWKFLGVDRSVAGNALKIGNKSYAKGLGAHAASRTVVALRGKYAKFQSDIGIDAETSSGSAVFQVFGDGKKLYESPVLKGGSAPVAIDVAVEGIDSLALVVTDAGDGNANDHADWGGAKLVPETSGVLDRGAVVGNWQGVVRGRTLVLDRTSRAAADLRVVDLRGRAVLSRRVAGDHVEIPLEGLSSGVYAVGLGASSRSFVLD
ncbi:MAG TPA: NPCBM/NEW2 domain-containing protein [Fibrobacteria bacterium]|nr:NPCBM/NEW2 domain-containing protein [Fibrobacteria bacterium]